MLKALFSPSTTTRFRRLASSASAVTTILLCNLGVAFSSDENGLLDPGVHSPESGRAKGLAYLDLPMELRARFGTMYTEEFYLSDELAKPYVASTGPSFRTDHSLESRIALTRSISDKIEIGIVWGARSPLSDINLFNFERQTVRAIVRIVP
jgi:hypothetical protein